MHESFYSKMMRFAALASSCASVLSHSSLLGALNPYAKGYPKSYVATPPLHDGNFTNKAGFLAAGNDILVGSYTYTQALSICSANVEVCTRPAPCCTTLRKSNVCTAAFNISTVLRMLYALRGKCN